VELCPKSEIKEMSKKPIRGRGVNQQHFREDNNKPGKVKTTRYFKGKPVPEPERHKCTKCGGPIRFIMLDNGKFCPVSASGGDHWDECREWQAQGTYGIYSFAKTINFIGPIWTPGHGTEKHRIKIGLFECYGKADVPW